MEKKKNKNSSKDSLFVLLRWVDRRRPAGSLEAFDSLQPFGLHAAAGRRG